MKNANDQKLKELLKSRPSIPARNDLMEQIVKAAGSVTQKKDEPLIEWLQGLFGEFIVLKPSYTLGLFLALGLCVGFISTSKNMDERGDHVHANQIQDFLYVKRSFL